MPQHVRLKTLRVKSAEFAQGLADIERRLAELEREKTRLHGDRTATAGAKYAIDQLIAGLAPTAAVSASAPAAPSPIAAHP